MQQENRAGATMTPALNQRPWSTPPLHTHPALGRRLDQDDPGVRGLVDLSYRSSRQVRSGDSGRSRSGIPGRSCYWGTMPEPRWPQREAATPVDNCLLTRPIPASACRHDQVPQVDRCGQLSVIPASTPGAPALVPAPGSRSRSPRQGRDFLWRNNTAITLARSRHPC